MSSQLHYVPILPNTIKPLTYLDNPMIKAAVDRLDSLHHEFDVGRAILSILRTHFPLEENWVIVPEFLVPERKKPDYCIEQYISNRPHLSIQEQFRPKIFVEIKSRTGDDTEHALDQATSSLVKTVDTLGNDFSCFLIVVKGKSIGFFEYHNDRSDLMEDGVRHHYGAISFNDPQEPATDGRPHYRGVGKVTYQDEYTEVRLRDQENVFLDLGVHDVVVSQVLDWMKNNSPLENPRGRST